MNEPVAWMDGRGNLFKHPDDAERGQTMRPLFFEQPASVAFMDVPYRTWVGLTDKEKNDCLVSADPCECLATPEAQQLMEDVESKLKEKNNAKT